MVSGSGSSGISDGEIEVGIQPKWEISGLCSSCGVPFAPPVIKSPRVNPSSGSLLEEVDGVVVVVVVMRRLCCVAKGNFDEDCVVVVVDAARVAVRVGRFALDLSCCCGLLDLVLRRWALDFWALSMMGGGQVGAKWWGFCGGLVVMMMMILISEIWDCCGGIELELRSMVGIKRR